ncbi:BsuPI-related putative proteinase inhibitor, partial [Mitsuokella jalaludinii]
MKKYTLIPALALAVGAISLSSIPVASASFGTGIGVSFPTSGSHSSEIVPSYAAFSFDKIVEELTVEEKHGRLVMELKVTNDGDSDYSIAHRDGQVYDFAILDKNGKTLYKWSDGMAFTQALTSSTVAAHKIEVYKAELDRKAYRKIKDDGVLVTAWLVDTPYKITTRMPTKVGNSTP